MPKFFMGSIVLLLLLGAAGYGIATIQARAIPWDCADWQAFAHSDRTTAILESLAENRGKTLYCGVDQSDTFTKAETWEAGKDRNERDDTVYFGERGQFRGFIAAQEGYLTDGESGVTGVSIDRIFEFPREERRYKRVKRFDVGSGPVTSKTDNTCMTDLRSDLDGVVRQPGTLICSGWGGFGSQVGPSTYDAERARSRTRAANLGAQIHRRLNWETQAITDNNGNAVARDARPSADQWLALAAAAADQACRARGARYVAGSAEFGPGHSDDKGAGNWYVGENLGWFYHLDPHQNVNVDAHAFRARQSRTWSATCKKVIRRTRK